MPRRGARRGRDRGRRLDRAHRGPHHRRRRPHRHWRGAGCGRRGAFAFTHAPPRQNCLVEEQVEIVNEREEPMVIGNWNAFEVPPPQRPSSGPRSSAAVQVGARCEAASIGNGNTLEARATVGPVRASPPPLPSPRPYAICLLRAQRWGTFASWAPAHRWGRWPRRLQTARWCTARPTPAALMRRASRPAEMVISLPSASRLARMAADWRRGAGRSDALEGELEVLRNGPLGTLKGGLKDFHPMLS